MTIYFRQSEIRKFKRCPRSWWLSYKREGWGYENAPSEKPQSGQRDLGTLIHSCIEALDNGLSWNAVLEAERLRSSIEGWYSKEWELEVFSFARIMMEGYVQWLEETGADANEELISSERQLEVPIGRIRCEDIVLTGRLDKIKRDRLTGEFIVVDVKTVTSLDQAVAQLSVDDQGLNYLTLLHAAEGLPVRRFRHDMLRKVKRTAKAVPPFYGRHEVAFNEVQLDNAWTHTVNVLDRMVQALQMVEGDEETNHIDQLHHRVMYPNPTKDCTWDCDFLPVCPMMDDGSDWKGMLTHSGLYVRREEPIHA